LNIEVPPPIAVKSKAVELAPDVPALETPPVPPAPTVNVYTIPEVTVAELDK
jgi:hypothetical protein